VAVIVAYGIADRVGVLDFERQALREHDSAESGCPITFLGHAATCTKTTLVGSTDIPYLKVEDGWNIAAAASGHNDRGGESRPILRQASVPEAVSDCQPPGES
jgi:hypothetical protein